VAPHQVNNFPRAGWFYDRAAYGGILVDIGAHQFDQFVFFTGSTTAEVVTSQIGNLHHPEHPGLEDFGDVMLRGDGGTGYARIDWLSPDALGTWGDLRQFIQGTDGYIEVRKNIDIGRSPKGDAVYLVDHKGITRFDCSDVARPFMDNVYRDITERTETALSQAGCFLAAELALKAQHNAVRLNPVN
jgi:predicted dehydrogenase